MMMIGNGHNDNIGVTMMLIMMGGQFAVYAAHATTSSKEKRMHTGSREMQMYQQQRKCISEI